MKKLLEQSPFGPLLLWFETLRYGIGIFGALGGIGLCQVYYWLEGYPEDYRLNYAVAAFAGSLWWVYVYIGAINGYTKSIVGWSAVLGLFMGLMESSEPHFSRYLAVLTGIALGGLWGAWAPLAWHRLKGRLASKGRHRKFVLALGLPFLEEGQKGTSLVSDQEDPFEAALKLLEEYELETREQLLSRLKELEDQEQYGLLVATVRWGVTAHFLEHREGWELLDQIPERARRLHDSWAEYGASLPQAERVQALLKGPWKRIPWTH